MRLVLMFLLAVSAVAQENTGPATFKTTTQLVVETVNVKTKDGKPVEGLTAKDFTISEDGVAQTIQFFEYQSLPAAAEPLTDALPRRPEAFAKLTRGQISPEPQGDLRYRNHRLLALYFDMSAMPEADQLRAFAAAQKFIRTNMSPADLMAVMVFASGSVQVLQDFTNDRIRLLRVIETLVVGEDENAPGDTNDASSSDTGAAFGQNDAEFNVFFTDRQLSALQTAATMLGRLNEKKSLIYFASGLRLNGTNNQAQLRAVINSAIRSGVSLWPVDARGLVAQAPLGDATRGSPGGIAAYSGTAGMMSMTNFQRSQDTLWTLAADTGGKALLDSNDLGQGILQAQHSIESYYILGYYTTNTNADGKFRRIKIELRSTVAANLEYRQGYYAGKVFGKFTAADKERQLEEALMLPDPITDLTVVLTVHYFQLNRAEYFVPVTAKIAASELSLARRRGAEHTVIDFLGEIKDEHGSTVSNVRDKVDIKLSDQTAAQLAKRPVEYDTGFTLLPGKYKIRFLARDAETGRIGTYETSFLIPNLNKEDKRIPISSVVLSSQQVEMKEALYTAGRDKSQVQPLNPLVEDSRKLIPSVTRVFAQNKELVVYFQAYQQQDPQPLLAFVTFYRNGEKALETAPREIKEGANNRLHTMPMKFTIPLDKLAQGEYTCQVSVIDRTNRRSAFWQESILLVP